MEDYWFEDYKYFAQDFVFYSRQTFTYYSRFKNIYLYMKITYVFVAPVKLPNLLIFPERKEGLKI